jgi:hypothetical protein
MDERHVHENDAPWAIEREEFDVVVWFRCCCAPDAADQLEELLDRGRAPVLLFGAPPRGMNSGARALLQVAPFIAKAAVSSSALQSLLLLLMDRPGMEGFHPWDGDAGGLCSATARMLLLRGDKGGGAPLSMLLLLPSADVLLENEGFHSFAFVDSCPNDSDKSSMVSDALPYSTVA